VVFAKMFFINQLEAATGSFHPGTIEQLEASLATYRNVGRLGDKLGNFLPLSKWKGVPSRAKNADGSCRLRKSLRFMGVEVH
jgi:hypothetical protein